MNKEKIIKHPQPGFCFKMRHCDVRAKPYFNFEFFLSGAVQFKTFSRYFPSGEVEGAHTQNRNREEEET